jgi:predicted nuclease with TOPRIM domain
MRKTAKIENQVLEMIQPRIQLIENKFSNGEALSDQDVNTLLLKSAFNHMNHFDLRLDEVAADVAQLRTDFCGLEGRFLELEGRFHVLEGRFHALEAKFTTLEGKFHALEGKFHALESRFQELENRFLVLEGKFQTLEAKFETLEARFISFESRMEAIIEKTMKSNIKWTLGLMTFCLTLFKIIDLVVQN